MWSRPHPVLPFLLSLLLVGLALPACSASPADPSRVTVGFIFVGERDDLGYNQAAWEGSEALARAFPEISVLRVEDVPETDAAVTALEELIDRGATILFATSFGHLAAAYEVAERHPEVTVLHEGGREPEPHLPNLGTYFGAHAEALYVAGIAAGAATTTGQLGFVVAFPIPATYANVDAFTLGARTVRPDVTTHVVFTDDWCDPDAQRAAFARLRAADVDVIAQHQDCTRTLLELSERAGISAVGYHYDGSEVAPERWLVGAVWSWDQLFIDIVRTIRAGTFVGSPYEGDFRGRLATGDNPFVLTEPGPSVSEETVARMDEAVRRFEDGATAFDGPIVDRDGVERVPDGGQLTLDEVDAIEWFVAGVEVEPTS